MIDPIFCDSISFQVYQKLTRGHIGIMIGQFKSPDLCRIHAFVFQFDYFEF